jgi:protein TonB
MFGTLQEQRARRGGKRTWLLTGSLALHVAALAVLAGFQVWRVEAVAEPPLVDVFEVQLPPPAVGQPAGPPPAPAHHQPAQAPPARAAVQPPPEVRQPDSAALQKHPDVPAPLAPAETAAANDRTTATGDASAQSRDASGSRLGTGDGAGGPGGPRDEGEAGDGAPLPIGGPITRPQIVPGTRVQPVYTELARQAHVQGVVVLQATIDERGNVLDIRVLKTLPMGLTAEAVKAVSQWKFTPATLHGRPVRVYFSVTVQFEAR